MDTTPEDVLLPYFRSHGYPDARPLTAGMEARVYGLGRGRIGKAWKRHTARRVQQLRSFYRQLATLSLPFHTPLIEDVFVHHAVPVSVERHLPGTPLQGQVAGGGRVSAPVLRALSGVLSALGGIGSSPDVRRLCVLDERHAFWSGGEDWTTALRALMDRRVARFGTQLRAAVTGFDARYARLCSLLEEGGAPERLGLVHGDLFGENILVDAHGSPISVLDFGFLTFAGDPAFDAGVTAGIVDMYGPHARAVDEQVTMHLAETLGHSRVRMLVYRAAYAVITSNAYDPNGQDGHFDWCVGQLRRPDVVEILS